MGKSLRIKQKKKNEDEIKKQSVPMISFTLPDGSKKNLTMEEAIKQGYLLSYSIS